MNLLIGMALILLFQFFHLGESVIVRASSKKHGSGGYMFNALISMFAMIFHIVFELVTDKNGLYFPGGLWLYGIISGLMFAGGFYFMFKALALGSFILTQMIAGFSFIIPMAYGAFFLNEPFTIFTGIGLALTIFAVLLTSFSKIKTQKAKAQEEGNEAQNTNLFSVKWLIYTLLSALCNGGIAIISRAQQLEFNDQCSREFLAISLGVSFLFLLTMALSTNIKESGNIFKKTIGYATGAGIFNAAKNIVNLFIYLFIPLTLLSPIKAGISKAFGFFVSVFLYKEKFTKLQLIAILLGLVAVVITSL